MAQDKARIERKREREREIEKERKSTDPRGIHACPPTPPLMVLARIERESESVCVRERERHHWPTCMTTHPSLN
jgi:hypothetical protein